MLTWKIQVSVTLLITHAFVNFLAVHDPHTPYTSPSTVLSIAVLPSETTHARQTAANTKQC